MSTATIAPRTSRRTQRADWQRDGAGLFVGKFLAEVLVAEVTTLAVYGVLMVTGALTWLQLPAEIGYAYASLGFEFVFTRRILMGRASVFDKKA